MRTLSAMMFFFGAVFFFWLGPVSALAAERKGIETYAGCITTTSVANKPNGTVYQFSLGPEVFTFGRERILRGKEVVLLDKNEQGKYAELQAQLRQAAHLQRQTYVSIRSSGGRAGEVTQISFNWQKDCHFIRPKRKVRPKTRRRPNDVKALSLLLSVLNAPSELGGGMGGFIGSNHSLGEDGAVLSFRIGGLFYPDYSSVVEAGFGGSSTTETVNGLFMIPALAGIKVGREHFFFYPEIGLTMQSTDTEQTIGLSFGASLGLKLVDTRLSVGLYLPDLSAGGDGAQTSFSLGQDF